MSEILVKCNDVSTINWEDCEPSIENFWENIKIADAMHSLQISLMLGEYYFGFNKYDAKLTALSSSSHHSLPDKTLIQFSSYNNNKFLRINKRA